MGRMRAASLWSWAALSVVAGAACSGGSTAAGDGGTETGEASALVVETGIDSSSGTARREGETDCAIANPDGPEAGVGMPITPAESSRLWASVRDSMGSSFTGTAWRGSTLIAYGTAASAPEGLDQLGDPWGIEIRYEQVAQSTTQIDAAIDWLGQYISSADLDIRTAYGDVSCGSVVVIVGSAEAAARLGALAGDAGHDGALSIHVDQDYVVRPRIPAAGEEPVIESGTRT